MEPIILRKFELRSLSRVNHHDTVKRGWGENRLVNLGTDSDVMVLSLGTVDYRCSVFLALYSPIWSAWSEKMARETRIFARHPASKHKKILSVQAAFWNYFPPLCWDSHGFWQTLRPQIEIWLFLLLFVSSVESFIKGWRGFCPHRLGFDLRNSLALMFTENFGRWRILSLEQILFWFYFGYLPV